jgi:pyruvate/2-oxoglutarate dehydrogenase complex dihydrolipoamide acyltransferase (E2) component
MTEFKTVIFPNSRIATIDIGKVSKSKHHVTALIEVDVTLGREKISKYKRAVGMISFNAWLIKTIALSLKEHETATAYLTGKRKLVIFDDINISISVEKKLGDTRVPVPMVIEKADAKSIETIYAEIEQAKKTIVTENDIVLQRKTQLVEKLYYWLPGFLRRYVWRFLLKHPYTAFEKMGNVAITSIGMIGKVNGWFIPTSVHPVCFGISSVTKKPKVVDNEIVIRDILNMTVLLDHDVIDGAQMARFISHLVAHVENASGL